jgi:hypothetical protein
MTKRSATGPMSASLPQNGHRLSPWRTFGLGISAIGAPSAASYFHPVLGLLLAASEIATIVTVVASALFGTSTISERAFRLLRWFADRPEPPSPPKLASSIPGSQRDAILPVDQVDHVDQPLDQHV